MKSTIVIGSVLVLLLSEVHAAESTCYGTTSKGRIENAVPLPSEGRNFVSYGSFPEIAGRTYVHSKVRDVIVDAYRLLEAEQPSKVYKFAETGLRGGGPFKPHKTHQNGLSVDFMVPVVDESGRSVHLPTHPLNRYGYDIEFDASGQFEGYRIDYEALAVHLVALTRAAENHGIKIWRVIFAPELAPNLYKTKYAEEIKQAVFIPNRPSWVRHDEHYHVDFDVPCRPH